MNRRSFLKTTGGVAMSSAAGSRASANSRITIAMMGVNGRGTTLTQHVASLPDVDIPYMCDVDQNVVEPAMKIIEEKKGKRPRLVDDIRRVLDDKTVDAVVVSTPLHWHAAGTILACDAGKDVYVEKPVSHNIREGRLMVDAARRNRRVVQVGTQRRSSTVTQHFIDYVRSGKLGDVLMAKVWNVQKRSGIGHKTDEAVPEGVNYDIWTGPVPLRPFNWNRFHHKYNWNWHYGMGDIGADGSHWLDLALWALDVQYPEGVSGTGRRVFFHGDEQTPDTQSVTYDYPGKVILYEQRLWNTYMMHGAENGIDVYGSDAMARLTAENGNTFRVFDEKGRVAYLEHEDTETRQVLWTLGGETHYQNFLRCIRTRERPNADIESGHLAAALGQLGNIVSRIGRNIRFDGKTQSIPNDPESNRLVTREYRQHWSSEPFLK